MRLARIRTADGVLTGEYEDGTVETGSESYLVGDDAELLAPCEPSALYCVGRNYATTNDQMGYERPERPDWFIKPPVSVLPHGAALPYPDWTSELTYAGELAAVIDGRCTNIDVGDVDDAVRGYTILNDLDALDQDGRTARKAFDGSAPLGPWVETELDPSDVEMTTHVGGDLRQEANTSEMLFSPREVIAFLSERYTFQPGDVVSF
ncbi:fumarylacetoacetase, partial [Haladaptatus sp. W1]|uniref:fumarylacetoacetate hydrolase family protein n=1 Tax=Haladaptatus sp. W1 TaxID=1897478 RepID=UPI000849A5B5